MRLHGSRVLCVGAVFALSTSLVHGARAAESTEQKDAAEKLFVEGQEAMSRGEQALACAKFHRSVERYPVPNAVANVARCAERDGRLVEALRAWEQVTAMLPPGDPRNGPARERVAALAAAVEANERKELAARAAAAPTAVVPPPRLPPRPPAPPAPAQLPPSNGPRAAAFTVGAVGVVGLVAAGITGGMLLGRDAQISELCPDHVCTPAGTQEIAGSKTLLVANAVAWGVGLAGVGAGAILFFTSRGRAAPATTVVPVVTSSGAGLTLGAKF